MRNQKDWQEDVRRISNLVVTPDKPQQVICITGMSSISFQKEICMILGQALTERHRTVMMINAEKNCTKIQTEKTTFGMDIKNTAVSEFEEFLKKAKYSYDFIIVNSLPIGQWAEGITVAAACDETILLIEKGKTNGSWAMQLKRQLDMNHVHILGSIFIR